MHLSIQPGRKSLCLEKVTEQTSYFRLAPSFYNAGIAA